MRRAYAGFLLLFLAPAALAQRPLSVGGVTARPGEKVSGYLEIPAGSDDGTRIPVSVVHGARPGPVLALIAGTHGYEYTSIVALPRVLARLDPSKMSGSVILVHMACPPTFFGRRIYYGPDGKNLNRMYPGKADGTVSERIAHALAAQVIDQATHVVDMHGGDGNESLRPYAYWIVTGNEEMDRKSKELVLAFGLDHVVIDKGRPLDAAKSLYTDATAILRGKPACTVELGGMGRADGPEVAAQEAGALSVVAHLGIMDTPSIKVASPVFYDRTEVLRSPAAGVWYPAVEKMQSVSKGTVLGRVADPFGKTLHELRSPFAGEVLYVVGTPPVGDNEPLAFVGHVQE